MTKRLDCLVMVGSRPSAMLQMRELERFSQMGKLVYFVTTRSIKGLWPKSSIVAFYGNRDFGNAYLGRAIFEDYVMIADTRTQKILQELPQTEVYRVNGIPIETRGIVELSAFQPVKAGETIDDLDGMMRIKGARKAKRLCLKNLPNSAARGLIYYFTQEN